MASLGSKVMQPTSVQDAKLNMIDIKVKSSFVSKSGTLITGSKKNFSNNIITGISSTKNDAKIVLKEAKNSIIVMRCYVSTSNLLKFIEKKQLKDNNLSILVSSNSKSSDTLNKMFHVKQEKFLINKNNFRTIDVITDM